MARFMTTSNFMMAYGASANQAEASFRMDSADNRSNRIAMTLDAILMASIIICALLICALLAVVSILVLVSVLLVLVLLAAALLILGNSHMPSARISA